MIRMIGGVVTGLVAAVAVILAVESVAHVLFPPVPVPGRSAAAAAEARLTAGLAATVLAGWTLGTFAGALLATRIARRGLGGYLVAAAIAALGSWTMTEFPHPLWMQVGGVLLPFAAALLAERLARRRF